MSKQEPIPEWEEITIDRIDGAARFFAHCPLPADASAPMRQGYDAAREMASGMSFEERIERQIDADLFVLSINAKILGKGGFR